MSARHAAFLQEMGLGPRWTLRHAPEHAALAAAPAVVSEAVSEAVPAVALPAASLRLQQEATDVMAPCVVQAAAVNAAPVYAMDWQQLQQSVAACTGCGLCAGRSNTVFGAGERKANWLFIGASPTAADEAAGLPLAGASGSLFDNMLRAIGLPPQQNVYLTNLLKCRPAPGADVSAALAACRPYLERQIVLLEPSIIIALGAEVGAALLDDAAATLAGLRGQLHRYAGLPLVVTYAPADLLCAPAAKAGAWSDLCFALNAARNPARNPDASR